MWFRKRRSGPSLKRGSDTYSGYNCCSITDSHWELSLRKHSRWSVERAIMALILRERYQGNRNCFFSKYWRAEVIRVVLWFIQARGHISLLGFFIFAFIKFMKEVYRSVFSNFYIMYIIFCFSWNWLIHYLSVWETEL